METIALVLFTGLIVGALARLAVPGPDPMPWWLTIGFGVLGSVVGSMVVVAMVGEPRGGEEGVIFLASVAAATLAIIGYRRFVQRRGITGPAAKKRPTRGFGLGGGRDSPPQP